MSESVKDRAERMMPGVFKRPFLDETKEAVALENALFDAMPDWMATKIFKAIIDLIEANNRTIPHN